MKNEGCTSGLLSPRHTERWMGGKGLSGFLSHFCILAVANSLSFCFPTSPLLSYPSQ